MQRWKYIKEQEEIVQDSFDRKITKILKILRDENFANEEQRKKFLDLFTTLHNSKDPRARNTFKKIGHILSDIGDDLINNKK